MLQDPIRPAVILEETQEPRPASWGHAIDSALHQLRRPFYYQADTGKLSFEPLGLEADSRRSITSSGPWLSCPSCPIQNLGDPSFRMDHQLQANYVAGAMANGIASVELVTALSHHGLLAFFGSAGLSLSQVASAIEQLQRHASQGPWGMNFIHSPNEPALEDALGDLYLQKKIHLVEASAFMDMTLPIVKYRLHGIHQDSQGNIHTPNRVMAKVSRVEVARKFMSPPPAAMIRRLVETGFLTEQQAQWAGQIPVAQDVTAEADSAGHTDNRPAVTLLPTFLSLRDRLNAQFGYVHPLRVGAAGGIGTPAAAAGLFAMGAAYVVTGSINQACQESGSSPLVRKMLAQAEQADSMMAPAADMFEMGVKVQVLKRGTLFPMRANKLYELYRHYDGLEAIPLDERTHLEKTLFRCSLEEIWRFTQEFFKQRDPAQIDKAKRDPKHRMALVFRWYLGQSSHWANQGMADRQMDFQVWSGPAMGAFNEWTKGTFLESPENRRVATIGLNIMYGAAVVTRAAMLRSQGANLPIGVPHLRPKPLEEWAALLNP